MDKKTVEKKDVPNFEPRNSPKTIRRLVNRYVNAYPELPSRKIRGLIRKDNPITSENGKKNLTRYLKEAFLKKSEVTSTDSPLSVKALEHSLALTEGLKKILVNMQNNEAGKHKGQLHTLVEEHLRSGYPKLYTQMLKLEEACKTRRRQKDVEDFLLSNEQVSATEKQELRACRLVDPDGYKLIHETRFGLIGEISNAIAMVEIGRQPLKGHCAFCPNPTTV